MRSSARFVFIIFLLGVRAVGAAEAPLPARADSPRSLAGHRFIPADDVPDPFVGTFVGMSAALGLSGLSDVPMVDRFSRSTGETKDLDLATLGQSLDLQLGLLDWLALRARLSGAILSGSDSTGALLYGAEFAYAYAFGASLRLLRASRVQIAVSGDVRRGTGSLIQPLESITRSLLAFRITTKGLFAETTSTEWGGGLQMALALHPVIGLWASGRYVYVDREVGGQGSASDELEAGVAASVDLAPATPVPIGLLASVVTRDSFKKGSSGTTTVGAGLFYTGREELVLGVELSVGRDTLDSGIQMAGYLGIFRLRYYW